MRLNCGDTCPKTGSYKVINEQGRVVNTVYVGEGETMPPTQYQGCHYASQNDCTTDKKPTVTRMRAGRFTIL